MGDQVLNTSYVKFGCDPELFLLKKGKVIGSEKVLPEEGLTTDSVNSNGTIIGQRKGIVLDGVQVELNPSPNTCRALLADEISLAFRTLKLHLAKMGDITASFSQIVEIDPKELEGLSDKSKALGCAPSNNIYDLKASIGVNPANYMKRSAGGHIHLGLSGDLIPHRERLIPLMDIFVGNTSVLMDRDPGNKERRKVYGRAGEYRTPAHGIEYRTLSNYWLRAYPLMSGVMGMSKLVVSILQNAVGNHPAYFAEAENKILKMVDIDAIRKAINTNDVKLAKKNWAVVSAYIREHVKSSTIGIHGGNIEDFDFFISKIDSDGIEYWFPDDPMEAWTTKYGDKGKGISETGFKFADGHGFGWEAFLSQVYQERLGKVPHANP